MLNERSKTHKTYTNKPQAKRNFSRRWDLWELAGCFAFFFLNSEGFHLVFALQEPSITLNE